MEKCFEFYDKTNNYHPERICPDRSFCCGPCELRYCCTQNFLKLSNQSFCEIYQSDYYNNNQNNQKSFFRLLYLNK
jgi:hypothetical protein